MKSKDTLTLIIFTVLDRGDEPDLSNTQFALEALRKAGVPASNPCLSKVIFYNDAKIVVKAMTKLGQAMRWFV